MNLTIFPTAYRVYEFPGYNIAQRIGRQHTISWAVLNPQQEVLNTAGEFDFEESPSARTPEWLAAHRFNTLEAAVTALEQYLLHP